MKAIQYTDDEKTQIITALRHVAMAQAELWDVLRDVEGTHECSIELDLELVGELAGGCNIPPSIADLPDESVWECFEEHAEVK